MSDFRILPAGDTALVVEFGDRIERRLNNRVLALAEHLNTRRIDGIVECVPTFRSLMVHHDPLILPHAVLAARISTLVDAPRASERAGRLWRLPMCYDAEVAPDLGDAAARANLSCAQAIERHSAVSYHVYMLGFLPGQAYMGDVAPELALPRRETPRRTIPAGSLGVAMTMTCIFPRETPCGWHLIGRSPVPLWDRPTGSAMLRPGDSVCFAPVSMREYEAMIADVANGQLTISPVNNVKDAAA